MLKYLLDTRKKFFSYLANDQDGYSAAFKYLSDNKKSVYELFNFNPEDNVNYKDQFQWFFKHHQIGLVAPESTERNQVNFNWDIHYDWTKHEKILKTVIFI